VVASAVMSFSKIVVCLEDEAESFKREWYFMFSVSTNLSQWHWGPFDSTGLEENEKLKRNLST